MMEEHLDRLIDRYPKLIVCREDIWKAYLLLEEAYSSGRKGGGLFFWKEIAGER